MRTAMSKCLLLLLSTIALLVLGFICLDKKRLSVDVANNSYSLWSYMQLFFGQKTLKLY